MYKNENAKIEYIRNAKKIPLGILIYSFNADNEIVFGWSLCHKKDKWNKQLAKKIAYTRYNNFIATKAKVLKLTPEYFENIEDFNASTKEYVIIKTEDNKFLSFPHTVKKKLNTIIKNRMMLVESDIK